MSILCADPGATGGLALLRTFNDGNLLGIIKTMFMPMIQAKSKKRVDTEAIFEWLGDDTVEYSVIENVHSMPRQGVASSFQFGRSFGALEGAMAGLSAVPLAYVEPSVWKVKMGLLGDDKEQARMRATRIFSRSARELHWPLVKHDGIAEACLIGYYFYNHVIEER